MTVLVQLVHVMHLLGLKSLSLKVVQKDIVATPRKYDAFWDMVRKWAGDLKHGKESY